MKQIASIISLCLCASVFNIASASVPLRWTVETSRAQPATFEAYQGETLALEASLQSYGKPLEASGIAALYWQTNGMGSAYWETTAAVNSNRLSAVFTPEMDVGAKVYNCFIGVPGTIYHSAFQLRLRPSPGATPNVLPLPVPVIDFSKVRVLNPPWEGGGGGGVNTNAVIDIIHETVDGAARPLPKYLHIYNADDSYPDAAAEYYRSRGNGKTDGGCSSVRDGGFLYRNFDFPFDDRAEFVVRMSAGPGRFASVGVAQVGTNLTEQIATSGKPEYSHLYKALPGATVDGINEHGVACNINVVDGDPQTSGWNNDTGDLHPLAAIRWILDNSTNAQSAAEYIASHIRFPTGWSQNFHYMIADATSTYIVENGNYYRAGLYDLVKPILTNFRVVGMQVGSGIERYNLLLDGANITNVWYTNAYRRETNPPWISEFGNNYEYMNAALNRWNDGRSKEQHRGESYTQTTYPFETITWWQTVHTSVYDISNRVLRVAVQETADWYTFQVPSSGAKIDAYTKAETDAKLAGKIGTNGVQRVGLEFNLQMRGLGIRPPLELTDGAFASVHSSDYEHPSGFSFSGEKAELDIQNGASLNIASGIMSAGYSQLNLFNGSILSLYEGANVWFGQDSFSYFSNNSYIILYGFDEYGQSVSGKQLVFADHEGSGEGGFETIDERIVRLAPRYTPSASDATFSNAVMGVASHTNAAFAAEVLAVQVASLSTNITAEVYIAATNACANLGIDPALIPGAGTTGTVGGIIVMLFAVVFWMRKKIFDNSGKVNDTFAGELLGKPVAINALHYALYSVPTSGADANKLKDRAVNAFTFSGGDLPTFPAQVAGYARDFLLNVTATADGSNITIPEPDGSTATSIGDALAFTAGKTYLVAITEIAAKHYYIRVIDTTPANAA